MNKIILLVFLVSCTSSLQSIFWGVPVSASRSSENRLRRDAKIILRRILKEERERGTPDDSIRSVVIERFKSEYPDLASRCIT